MGRVAGAIALVCRGVGGGDLAQVTVEVSVSSFEWGDCGDECAVVCLEDFVGFQAEWSKVLGSFLWGGVTQLLPFAHHLRCCYSLEVR